MYSNSETGTDRNSYYVKPRILFVDDYEPLLDTMCDFFSSNYEVLSVLSVDECWKVLGIMKPDLIILDVELGAENGVELCRELKLKTSTRHIPIFIFTAHATNILSSCAKEAGAQLVLSKGSSLSVLEREIKSHFHREGF